MSLHDQLRELFLLDQQVRGLRTRLDAALARLKSQQTRLAQATQQRDEMKEQHLQAKVQASACENQVREIDEKVTRLRDQMNAVKTNKEYSTLLVEVNTLKVEKDKIEETALNQLSQVDALAKQLQELEDKLNEQQKLVGLAQAEVTASHNEIGTQLDELTAKRTAAEEQVPVEARTVFDRLANIHDGEPMAVVIEESRRHKEYSCGGCYIAIPAERVNALLVRDEIVCCPSCGRILFLDQEFKASMGGK